MEEAENKLLKLGNKIYQFSALVEEMEEDNREGCYHHTWENHIVPMFESMLKFYNGDAESIPKEYILALLYHNIVYDPKSNDNEEQSIERFKTDLYGKRKHVSDETAMSVIEMIRSTKYSALSSIKEYNDDVLRFVVWHLDYLHNDDLPFSTLIEIEKNIQKEYQFMEWMCYKEQRIAYLKSFIERGIINRTRNIDFLIDYIENYIPKIGVYAGSFDPFHVGHKNILQQAEKFFDKVIVVQEINPASQPQTLLTNIKYLRYHQTETYDRSLVEYLKQYGYFSTYEYPVTLIRELNVAGDIDKERIRQMSENIRDVVYFIGHVQTAYLSLAYKDCHDINMFNSFIVN